MQQERIGKYLIAVVLLPQPPDILGHLHIAAELGIHLEVQQSQCLLPPVVKADESPQFPIAKLSLEQLSHLG